MASQGNYLVASLWYS